MTQNFKQAVRALLHRPGFTALVVVITGLCIGGNASVFSAAKAVLFQDLAYRDADRLVHVSLLYHPTGDENDLSYPEILDFQQRVTLLEDFSPFRASMGGLLRSSDAAERIGVMLVGPSHFQLLGIKPQLGRAFSATEEGVPGSAPVAILSHELWERFFSKDPDVIDKAVQIGAYTYTVIGVLPPRFLDVGEGYWEVDAWLPAVQVGNFYPTISNVLERRDTRIWQGIARLKPGISLAEARKEIESIGMQLAAENPATNRDYGARVVPLRRYMFGDLHQSMRILLAGAILILLVGCANIAALLLVRVVDRRNELTLRLALGANRSQLIRQVLLESLILALVGGVLGVGLAFGGVKILSGWMDLPEITHMSLDGVVLSVILAVSVLTGILFGLPPAIGAARMELRGGLLQRTRSSLGGGLQGSKTRSVLLVFQVAVVTVLLLISGLLLRSFVELRNVGVDFDTERLLSMRMSFTTEDFQDRQNISNTERELLEQLRTIPGVEAVVFWGAGLPGIYSSVMRIQVEGAAEGDTFLRTSAHSVSPGALKDLGISLLQGRELTAADTSETQRVGIITRSIAEAFWPGQDPIGKRIQRAGRPDEGIIEIVGVIPDSKLATRFTEGFDQLIMSHEQRPTSETTLLVRTSGAPLAIVDRVRQEIQQIAPDVPPHSITTIEEELRRGERSYRMNAAVLSMYAVLALIFATLGVYGTLAYSILQRTQEIGIRVAFGARRGSILKMVMRRGLGLVAIGAVIGMVGAFALTPLVSILLYGVTAHDPITFVVAVAFLGVVALVSTYLPARRALKIEPTEALRFE